MSGVAAVASFAGRTDLLPYLFGSRESTQRRWRLRPGREILLGVTHLVFVLMGSWMLLSAILFSEVDLRAAVLIPAGVLLARSAYERSIDPRRAIEQQVGTGVP